jgi:hypothetical protein
VEEIQGYNEFFTSLQVHFHFALSGKCFFEGITAGVHAPVHGSLLLALNSSSRAHSRAEEEVAFLSRPLLSARFRIHFSFFSAILILF